MNTAFDVVQRGISVLPTPRFKGLLVFFASVGESGDEPCALLAEMSHVGGSC